MRLAAFIFLLNFTIVTAVPLSALAAQDQKALSEEEEIALMMEQLEQFKASWESKEKAAKPKTQEMANPPAVVGAQPIRVVPKTPIVPQAVVPSIKITTQQTGTTAQVPAQIKTQDGRIFDAKQAPRKTEIKIPPQQPALKKISVEAEEIPDEIVEVKSEDQADFLTQESEKEKTILKNAVPVIDQDLIKKLNLPVKPRKTTAPAVQLPIDQLQKTAKAALKGVPDAAEQQEAAEVSAMDSTGADDERVEGPDIPEPQKSIPSSSELKKPEVLTVSVTDPTENMKTAAALAEDQQVVNSADEVIVVVQDEAAQYRAAREKAVLKEKKVARVVESDETKTLGRRQGVALPADARSQTRSKWVAARKGKALPVKKAPPKPNLFAETFFLNSEQRLAYDVYDIDGFIFVKSPNPDLNTKYAVVTGFGGGAVRTRSVPNLQTLEEAKKWVADNLKTEKFESVEIKKMNLGKNGSTKELYWVGQKAFPDFKTAQQEVAVVQSIVTTQGGDFTQLVSEASTYAPMTDGAQGAEIKGPANFEREEGLMLKYLDQLDVGEKLFGPFQGDSSGESFSWQSFGETTWRRTNLDRTDYRSQVGFWTNRVVFKGFRFPMNTVDAFLEDTVSLDSTSADFSSNMKLFAGLEWRPFARNPWLYNYRPWGGISVLEWIKNFRFYLMYGERKAIKDPIEGSADTDLIAGVQIFYEWGVELPPLNQAAPKTFSDFVERYFWGEYFGDYRHEMTNFGSEDDYNSWLGNSSVTMGVKLPGIPLPANPINEELMLMPYMRFEHVNSAEFSFPYQNQYFVAAGMRWMPWRNYRFKENEWLSKAKFFGEYVGVGLSQHAKQDEEAPNAVRWDLRFGVSFSSRRY